ncbi:hypothetical protein F4821DRAFT_257919 [Hypoxylon rubiginosum]|uniref:Uncharacterized protein n=1 Tax=Hypoxylon rubiginosum TaxID=110542 RepID=A0ACC0D705_9PEZI|nr:hypothetical protein F4821DRAFT_257919 [Hypoxylon rubiginosum]
MGKDSVKSSGSASRKANKTHREDTKKKNHSDMYAIDRYVASSQTHEEFATSGSSNRDATQYALNWDKTWDAASGRKN